MKTTGKIELRLYASNSLISARAVFQWLELLEQYPKGSYVFRLRDVNPDSTAVTQAELDEHGVSFTPCLVARGNDRTVRIIGDLTSSDARTAAVNRLRAVGLVIRAPEQAAS